MHLGSVWPNLAKFPHLDKTYKNSSKILMVYLVFGNILNLLWLKFYGIGRILFVVNDQIMKNNNTIWSHCLGSPIWIFLRLCSVLSFKDDLRRKKSQYFNTFLQNRPSPASFHLIWSFQTHINNFVWKMSIQYL